MVCKTCGEKVYQHGERWFHDVMPRTVATEAHEVEPEKEES